MRLKSSIFNKGYFIYNLKKTWPLLFLAGVPLLWSVMFRGMRIPFDSSGLFFLHMENLVENIPLLFLTFLPILAFSLFSTLYKRNSSDFIGSAPLRRSSLFYTNALLGILYIFFVVAIYTLVTCVFLPAGSTMVFEEVCRYFFLVFSGALFVFSLCCFAVVLSGTKRAFFVLAFVLGLVLPIVLYLLQGLYMSFSEANAAANTYEYAWSFWMPLSFPSSLFVASFLVGFWGTLLQTFYNLALAAVFFALGSYALRKRPFEMAETHYRKELVLDILMILAFLPAIVLQMQSVLSDSIFPLLFSFFFFGAFSLIMRRGFRRFGRAALSWLCAIGLAFVLFFCTATAAQVFPSYGEIPVDRVSSVTVHVPYLEKVNLDEAKTALGRITLTESAEIRLALANMQKKESSYYGFFLDYKRSSPESLATVRFTDGTEKTFSFLSDRFLREKLAADPSFYTRWATVTDEGSYAGAELVVVSPQENTTATVLLTNKQIEAYVSELRREKRALSLEDRIALRNSISVDSFGFDNLPSRISYEGLQTLTEKTAYYVAVYTYSNGTYFCELLPVSTDSAAFESIMGGNILRAEKMMRLSKLDSVNIQVMDYPQDFLAQVPDAQLRRIMVENLYEAYGEEFLSGVLHTSKTSSLEKRTTTIVLKSSSDSVVLNIDFASAIRPFWLRLAEEFEEKMAEVLDKSLFSVQVFIKNTEATDPWLYQQNVLSLYADDVSQSGKDRMLLNDLLSFLRSRMPEISQKMQNGFTDLHGQELLIFSVLGDQTLWQIPLCADDAGFKEVLKPYRVCSEISIDYLISQTSHMKITVDETTVEVFNKDWGLIFGYIQYEEYFSATEMATIEIVWEDGSIETIQRKIPGDVWEAFCGGA